MRYFETIQMMRLESVLIEKARAFAKAVTFTIGTPGQGYRDTHQRDLKKIENDHFVSKLGEEAVRLAFEKAGQHVRGPDYAVYEGKAKSWAADLYVNGIDLAVKTQAAALARRFGLSWTFQAGTQRYDPILNQPEAWVCFVEVGTTNYVCRVFPPYQIKELTFGEPKLAKLKGSKKVVYVESLQILKRRG